MRYSLVSRFRGTLLGSSIGDALTTDKSLTQTTQQLALISQYQPSSLARQLKQFFLSFDESSQLEQIKLDSSAEWAYLILPIILFYHENHNLLRQEIERLASFYQWSVEILADVLLWSDIVVLILKEKLDTNKIVEQLLASTLETKTSWWQLLPSLQIWLSEGFSLEQVVKQLSRQTPEYSLPLSLYCFASTPENFNLALSRASYSQNRAKMVTKLTGALAGGYNTIMGIPITWRKLLAQNKEYQVIERQGTTLFHKWSGLYQKKEKLRISENPCQVIAVPGIIQTRSSLRIISQQE